MVMLLDKVAQATRLEVDVELEGSVRQCFTEQFTRSNYCLSGPNYVSCSILDLNDGRGFTVAERKTGKDECRDKGHHWKPE